MYEYKVVRINRHNKKGGDLKKMFPVSPGNRADMMFSNYLNNESVDGWEFYCFRGFGAQAVFRRKKK